MNNKTEDEYQSYYEYKAAIFIWKVFPPILISCGTIGNALSVVILWRKSLRSTTTALFLTFLTFSDLVVLYTGLLRQWLIYLFKFDIRHISEVVCKINTWLVYSSLDFSAWILIAVTLERVVAVWCPYNNRNKCSKRNALILIITILFSLLGLNSHLLYGMIDKYNGKNEVEQKCSSIDVNYSHFFRSVWSWVDLCVFCLFPFLVIVSGNSLILFKICRRPRSARPKIFPPEQTNKRTHLRQSQHSSVTFILLTLNTMFVITTFPISVYNIGYTHWHTTKNHRIIARLELWWAIVNMLMYTNNAINFLLYCLSGSLFRREMKQVICRKNNSETQLKASGTSPNRMSSNEEGNNLNINQVTNFLQIPSVNNKKVSNACGFGSCNMLCSETVPVVLNNDHIANNSKCTNEVGDTTTLVADEKQITLNNCIEMPKDEEETVLLMRTVPASYTPNALCDNSSLVQSDRVKLQDLNINENDPQSNYRHGKKFRRSKAGERLELFVPLTSGNLIESLDTDDETRV